MRKLILIDARCSGHASGKSGGSTPGTGAGQWNG
jgi:hypothetical protein